MGKIITLPGGVKFDPESGELIGADFRRPSIPSNTSYNYSSGNWWTRANNFIIGIGNWFAEHNSNITGGLAVILLVLAWIYFGISVIGLWIQDGFFSALIFGIIGGVIFYYISMIAAGILIGIGIIILAIIRYIFYNIYTLILTIGIVLFFCFNSNGTSSYSKTAQVSEEVTYDGMEPIDPGEGLLGSIPNGTTKYTGDMAGFPIEFTITKNDEKGTLYANYKNVRYSTEMRMEGESLPAQSGDITFWGKENGRSWYFTLTGDVNNISGKAEGDGKEMGVRLHRINS